MRSVAARSAAARSAKPRGRRAFSRVSDFFVSGLDIGLSGSSGAPFTRRASLPASKRRRVALRPLPGDKRRAAGAGLMKIATFNVNGVNGRLPVLLRWLAESAPDVVCLQELKTPQERF